MYQTASNEQLISLPLTYELCMSAKYLDQYVIWTKLVANIII